MTLPPQSWNDRHSHLNLTVFLISWLHGIVSFAVNSMPLDLHLDHQPSEILTFSLISYYTSWRCISGCYHFDQTNKYFLSGLQLFFYYFFKNFVYALKTPLLSWDGMEGVAKISPWRYLENWYCVTTPLCLSYCHQHPQEKDARESRLTVLTNSVLDLFLMSSQNFLVILLLSSLVRCYALQNLIVIIAFLFSQSFLSAPSHWTFCILCISFTITSEPSSWLVSSILWFQITSNTTRCLPSTSSSLLKKFTFPLHPFLHHRSPLHCWIIPRHAHIWKPVIVAITQKNSTCNFCFASNKLLVGSYFSAPILSLNALQNDCTQGSWSFASLTFHLKK